MSIFESLSNAITPDYFGDELGVPLPQYSTSAKIETTIQVESAYRSGKATLTKASQAIVEEVMNGFVKYMKKIPESRELRRGEPALAPMFDGLNCFETVVISTNSK